MRIRRLEPGVQHYPWGDEEFIPKLLGRENPEKTPCAELWMGAHPELPSRIDETPLDAFIARAPDEVLGADVALAFGGKLPFLLKILCAKKPLSIQAHPNEQRAREGFERENRLGVPIDAPHRSYRDPHPKPELIVALTDFYALKGFRSVESIASLLRNRPELGALVPGLEPGPLFLKELYERLMSLPQEAVDAALGSLLASLDAEPVSRAEPEFWLLRCHQTFSEDGHYDRGLFSILLLNLVHLRPEDALYLDPGTLHQYLEGTGVEVMASSNNVLRGGLTRKHVDVAELLRVVTFEEDEPVVLRPERLGDTELRYRTPAREFALSRVEISSDRPHVVETVHGPEIGLVLTAEAPVTIASSAGDRVALDSGGAFFAGDGTSYSLATSGPSSKATIYKVGVPLLEPSRFRGRRPTELRFGTSGLRGLVADITDLEAYVNTRGFLDYLLRKRAIYRGDPVCLAGDLRPSTDRILGAVARAVQDTGLRAEHLGRIPTPALTLFALAKGCASVMVTGSHIPFDRNGIKFNKPTGELLKDDEQGVLEAVLEARRREYGRAPSTSPFRDDGMLEASRARPLPPAKPQARERYVRRYLDFFRRRGLKRKRILVFQHSAVGRDILADVLRELGAEVLEAGRSETFVPIDTENVQEDQLAELQRMVDEAGGPIDAIVSTDGDSDRPLVLGTTPEGQVRFIGGDLLGILVAEYLGADAVVVPVSANDAVDLWFRPRGIEPVKTKIGSPYVIAAIQALRARGEAERVVGWEANGGFLTGSEIVRDGRLLAALPTRDAVLPILAILYASAEKKKRLVELFSELPPRFGRSGLLDPFPREASLAILERFRAAEQDGAVRKKLARFFSKELGFGPIAGADTTDGLRIRFENGDIAHIRPSGNAPQLRIYAVADTQERADAIVQAALEEPKGILRRLSKAAGS